ncbi:MAG: hypothetical protein R3A44_45150 [Caldilineaceae bacterium]
MHAFFKVAQSISDSLVLPVTVLPEVSYLLGSRLGHTAMRNFLRKLAASNGTLETITVTDLKRATEILDAYADSLLILLMLRSSLLLND